MSTRKYTYYAYRVTYYLIVLVVIFAAFRLYTMWLDSYTINHPLLLQAESGIYTEELPLDGVLLWDEKVVNSPVDGVLRYTSQGPHRVRRGEVYATVGEHSMRANTTAYFVPALDGLEGHLDYTSIWPGTSALPTTDAAVAIEDGVFIRKDSAIGKLIVQPQDLRCVAWLDKTQPLADDIERGRIRIKIGDKEWPLFADVRTSVEYAQRVKIYLTMPFFTPEMAMSRSISCRVVTGKLSGIHIPTSAMTFQNGKMGVFVVYGSKSTFKEVRAFHVKDGGFFITSGVVQGDMIVANAAKAREGIVSVW